MRYKVILTIATLWLSSASVYSQITDASKDSLFIVEVEDSGQPDKVLHAEPLYIDLIRDLGARKGEREWNVGFGISDNLRFDTYEALVEYEWAPVDRLGLEIELPFTFYAPLGGDGRDSIPSNRLNSVKLAAQWSFFVSEAYSTSMAIGYINEFELSSFNQFKSPFVVGNVYNPFFVVAKRWGNNYHTLIYTGPRIEQHFESNSWHSTYDINTNFHYMIPGTRNFLGVEFNKELSTNDFDMTIRPQMRLGITDDVMIGIVVGIPVNRENERFSSFIRLIWEPGH
ncbi:HAEPLYID family protein [Phaeocystidibacter luteus]|uniref:Phosphoribosylformylglycinamidine synthase n=1 Tax=Phaeocystidibacter luteus TaxID=911197 RepID=A0A6N6RCV3_9FLAO|nr:HAEPLYID family protein [Phaeocystidibacter luteus]KAB2805426.1 phosphoribosylformylglycinamidine synthase [Phaeocystidibacter luteus]